MKWKKNRGRPTNRWHRRETSWVKQRIMVKTTDGRRRYFNRYDYAMAFTRQKGLCGLCGKELKGELYVIAGQYVRLGPNSNPDHDHRRSLFRSLVHGLPCNRHIGDMTLSRARQIVEYLRRFET